MNIDNLLVDLEIVGQIQEYDKLAVCNVVGATKLIVNQAGYLNGVYRKYNGYNRGDSIEYLETLTMNKIKDKEFKLKSKGILNLNKAKISIKENFTNKQFNDNELKKLSTTLNTSIISGKLENLFNISRYFNLF